MSTRPLAAIQILRAVAALMVVVAHCWTETTAIGLRVGLAPLHLEHINFGGAIELFFVISGFIMVHSTAHRFGRPGAVGEFAVRRLIRVVPLYWLVTTALLLGALVAPRLLNVPIDDWRHVLASYLFVPDARANGEMRPVMALGWTLEYEMLFYAVFAAAMAWPLRRGLTMVSAVFLGFVAFGSIGEPQNPILRYWVDPIVIDFLLGIGVGLAYRSGIRLPARVALPFGVAAGAALLFLTGTLGDPAGLPRVLDSGIPAALVVAAAALGPNLRFSRLLAPSLALGDASYSLYLIHPFAIRPLRDIWVHVAGARLPLECYILVACAVAVGAGLLMHRFVERPMTAMLNTRVKRRPVGQTLVVAGAAP